MNAIAQTKIPLYRDDKKAAGDPGFARLNADMLARKGSALPALSQETKILADVGLRPPAAHDQSSPAAISKNEKISDNHVNSSPPSKPSENLGQHPSPDDASTEHGSTPEQGPSPELGPSPEQMARVTFRMPMADYLRLKMAGALKEQPCRELILKALEDYFDKEGVQSFSDCPCFKDITP